MSLKHRVAAGFAVLCALFLALVLLQLVAGDRLQARHDARTARMEGLFEANREVLQGMTDAETAVRGLQLTGEQQFLEPYESGKRGAFAALDRLDDAVENPVLVRLVTAERQAVNRWLYAYGIPIINAGVADGDLRRAARGKELFDDIRAANALVGKAVEAERAAVHAADRRDARRMQLIFGGLALLVLLTGAGLALLHQRYLLGPLEHIRRTLRRLADGDRAARAEPTGPAEMRAVIGTLNDLAAETERLIDAEQARVAAGEARHRVAARLRSGQDPETIGRQVLEVVADAFGAGAAYALITVGRPAGMSVCWPSGAAEPDPELVRQVRSGRPGVVRVIGDDLVIALSGDDECPPGALIVHRPGGPAWTGNDERLLARLAREIEHAVGHQRLHLRQDRLISELRQLDEQKDVFVATVTHELRTPLTSILGYTELLTADDDPGGLSPMQRRGLDAILRNAHRLEATVGDLLLLDGANGRLGPEPGPVDLTATLTGVHEELAGAARAKHVQSVLEAEPVRVLGDGAQLERALRKLVDNAIKFTPPGGRFELRLSIDGDEAVITVSDTGMGIPADDLPGLFTPFHRAANAMHQAVQGPGLGLAIVRNIVTEHGGSVSARSELGKGSTFTLILPVLAPTAEEVHS
ncbi:ATP-binding protein [Actinoplanes sp. CA-030573]|uniref:ATP-binding protein n=1 Tax=Actinoplanes sp. CA-030573 TaxID=3239898 RepID=UPI003D8C2D86